MYLSFKFSILCCFLCGTHVLEAIVYLRDVHPTGPSAIQAGVGCLNELTKHYFEYFTKLSLHVPNLIVFHMNEMTSPAIDIEENYLKLFHKETMRNGTRGIQLRILGDHLRNFKFFGMVVLIDFYMIIVDSLENLLDCIHHLSKIRSWNPTGKFIILFNNPNGRENGKILALKVLTELFIQYHTVNVVFAFATKITHYELYTGDPYVGNEDECGKMKSILIGRCLDGRLEQPDFTRRKLQESKVQDKMETCTFKVCARIAEPYVNGEDCRTGLEISVVNILKTQMKFQVNLTCYESTYDRGEPIANDSIGWSHLLGDMRSDKCDFIVGAFFPDYEVHADFGSTFPIFQNSYTWFVSVSPFIPRWMGLLSIFTAKTWAIFAVMLIISSISWYTFGRMLPESTAHRNFSTCLLNSWCVSLSVSTINRPNYLTLRIFFGFLTLYAMNVNTIYTSKLITVFTRPVREHQIDTIEEILEKGMPIGGHLESRDWFENNDDEIDKIIQAVYNFSDEFSPSIPTLHRVINGTLSSLMSRHYVKQQHLLSTQVHGFTQNVFTSPIEIICEKGFPLLKKFNQVLSNINDMGLTNKLMKDFNFNTTILQHIRNRNRTSNVGDQDIVLTIEHLQSAFIIFLFGIFVSSFIFIMEIIASQEWMQKVLNSIWIKMHKSWWC